MRQTLYCGVGGFIFDEIHFPFHNNLFRTLEIDNFGEKDTFPYRSRSILELEQQTFF